jgi:UDP-2-acetamido-3-amino-2,3-dideoxy-glucuronate N-acetyltransferase
VTKDKDIRVAAIGVGYWGKNLARNFAQMGNLVAVADFDASTAEKIAAEHGCSVRTVEEVIADPAIDAVALATPAGTHADLAVRALDAGKHVYVEKPLALNREDAERVIEAAERSGHVLMVGHLLQYHPIFVRLLELVEAGELGQLHYVYSNRMGLGKFRTEENVLWSFAPHDFSMLLALAGELPSAVSAHGAAYVTPGIADWSIAHLQFPSGLRGHVQASWSHPFKEHRLVVVGDKGMAVFEDSQPEWDKRLAIYRHGVDRSGAVPVPIKADPEYVKVAAGEPLRDECQHFLNSIASGARPRTDGQEGLRVLDVLQRAEAGLLASIGKN